MGHPPQAPQEARGQGDTARLSSDPHTPNSSLSGASRCLGTKHLRPEPVWGLSTALTR